MRTQILEVATRHFAARGYDGTSLQGISDAVGIRKPSLLYHFPSKEELHRSVLDRMLARWNDVLPRLLLAAAGDTRFDAVMGELVGFFVDDPDRARLLVREVLDRPEAMRAQLHAHVQPWIGVVAKQIETMRERGLVHADVDAESYAVHVIHLVVGGIAMLDRLSVLLPDEEGEVRTRDRHVRELVRIARASLFVPHAQR